MTKTYQAKPIGILTAQLPYDYCCQFQQVANQLGISRHKLLKLSIETGLPLAAAKMGYQQSAADNEG